MQEVEAALASLAATMKAEEVSRRPGPSGRVFASFGQVRGQVGGKLDGRKWTETDEMTPDNMANPAGTRGQEGTTGRALSRPIGGLSCLSS